MRNSTVVCVILTSIALAFAGCTSYEDRLPVSGYVMLDGKPLENGMVNFIGKEGYVVGAGSISDGRYQLNESSNLHGISAGEYTVRIESWKEVPGAELPNGTFSQGVSAIPSRYSDNKESGLTATVTERDRKFNFDLVSAAQK